MPARLVAWPHFPGRAEFIRLYLEDCGHTYQDVAREHGLHRVVHELQERGTDLLPYDQPVLLDQTHRVTDTANILLYLCETYHPVDVDKYQLHALQSVIMRVVDDIETSHHPLDPRGPFEMQKHLAVELAEDLRVRRLPHAMRWFEEAAGRHDGPWLFETLTYADLSLAHLVRGLWHTHPKTMTRLEPQMARLHTLVDEVTNRPRIAEYLASERYLPFNDFGLFRFYRTLDE